MISAINEAAVAVDADSDEPYDVYGGHRMSMMLLGLMRHTQPVWNENARRAAQTRLLHPPEWHLEYPAICNELLIAPLGMLVVSLRWKLGMV